MEDYIVNAFSSHVDSELGKIDLYQSDQRQIGVYSNTLLNDFATKYKITKEDDLNELRRVSEEQTTKFKNENNILRFIPNETEAQELYNPIYLAPALTTEEKVSAIDKWRKESFDKASKLRPSDKDDIKTHLDYLSNNFIRTEVGKETGKFGDFSNRLVQGLGETMYSLFDHEGSQRYFAEHFPENPQYDQNFASQVAAGIGDTTTQVLLSIGSSLAAGPEAGVAVLTAYNAARSMKGSYEEEMARSNNPELALDVAVNQIPAVALESFADTLVLGRLNKIGLTATEFKTAFQEASTEAAKRTLLKEFIPSIGKHAIQSGISEATAGGYAAEWAGGYGSYLATGDEKYLKTQNDLIKSGLVEGTVGILFGGISGAISRGSAISEASGYNQPNADKIREAISNGDFDSAVAYMDMAGPPASAATNAIVPAGTPAAAANANQMAQGGTSGTVTSPFFSIGLDRKEQSEYNKIIRQYENEKDPTKKAELEPYYRRVVAGFASLQDPAGFKLQNEFESTLQDDNLSFEIPNEKITLDQGPPRAVTLEDGSEIPNDADAVVYTNSIGEKAPISLKALNRINLFRGAINMAFSRQGTKARLVFTDPSGKVAGISNGVRELNISHTPRKGWTPILLNDEYSANSDTTKRKIRILSPVKETSTLKKGSFEYVDSVIDSNGNLSGVRVKVGGKQMFVRGRGAETIAKSARQDYIEQNAERFAKLAESQPKKEEEGAPANNVITEEQQNEELAKQEQEAGNAVDEILSRPATEEDVFSNLPFVAPLIRTVTALNPQERYLQYDKYKGNLGKAIIAVQDRLERLLDRSEGSDAYQQLFELYEFLSSIRKPINPGIDTSSQQTLESGNTQVLDEQAQPSAAPEDGSLADQTIENKEQRLEEDAPVADKNISPEPKTLADFDGKSLYYYGLKGTIRIEDGSAILVRNNGEEYILGGSASEVHEVEGISELSPASDPEGAGFKIEDEPEPTVPENEGTASKMRPSKVAKFKPSGLPVTNAPEIEMASKPIIPVKIEGGNIAEAKKKQEANVKSQSEGNPEVLAEAKANSNPTSKMRVAKPASNKPTLDPARKDRFGSTKELEDNFINIATDADVSKDGVKSFLRSLSKAEVNHIAKMLGTKPTLEDISSKFKKNSPDKFTRDFLEAQREDSASHSYSISGDSALEGATVTQNQVKNHIKSVFGVDVKVVNTTEATPTGKQWNGRRQAETGEIQLNARNISSLEEAERVFREEIFHAAYANDDIKSAIDDVLLAIPDLNSDGQTLLDLGYEEGSLTEEQIVKGLNDLIDKWNARSAFDQFIQKIKTFVKDVLGIRMNDNDAQLMAKRILDKTLTSESVAIQQDRYSLSDSTDIDVFKLAMGKIEADKSKRIKAVKDLLNKKIEAKLKIAEPALYSALKGVKYAYLNDASFARYHEILSDFINTRSKVKDPALLRNSVEIHDEVANISKESQQNWFDDMQNAYPEVLGDKDFNGDFEGDVGAVADLIKQSENFPSTNDIPEEHVKYIEANTDLQLTLADELNNFINGEPSKLSELFDLTISNAKEFGNDILNKANDITQAAYKDAKSFFVDYITTMSAIDPAQLSFKDSRKLYYNLLSTLTDGYPTDIQNFITSDIRELLATRGIKFSDPFSRKKNNVRKNVSSYQTLVSRLGAKEASDAIHKMTSLYRDSLKRAEQFEAEVIVPYGNYIQDKLKKAIGRYLNNNELNQLGMFGYLRQFHVDEVQSEAMMRNIKWMKDSIARFADSNDKAFRDSAVWYTDFLNKITENIPHDAPPTNSMEILEQNAQRLFGDAQLQYVKDSAALFESMKGMQKFVTEFVHGKPFHEIINYIPAFSTLINGENQSIDPNGVMFDMQDHSYANGMVGYQQKALNRTGMSSIKDRHRVLGQDRSLVFNINHLVQNRGRLNAIDIFTAIRRRELSSVINNNNKEFQEWIGDPNNQKGRADLLRHALQQTWVNTITASTYLGDFHRLSNALTSRLGSVKLSAIYQLPAQTISNSATYLVANVTRPQRIRDFFAAYSWMHKAKYDPAKSKLLDSILFDIRNRTQDASMDKSVSLDVAGKSLWQEMKATKTFSVLKDLDQLREKVLFAQFKFSDIASGHAMMLSEYLNQERDAGRATSFDNMSYNPESYFKSLDEVEKMIGIGAASRRGAWMHNNNAAISLVRNLTMMFASHRINNATNFEVALARLRDTNSTRADKERAASYMMGLVAQTAAFNVVKVGMLAFLGNIIIGLARGDEDDGIEKLYAEKEDAMDKEEKAMIQQEIAIRRQIRAAIASFKSRGEDASVLSMNFGKDLLGNMYIGTALSDTPLDFIIHTFYDSTEEKVFKEFKEAEVERLRVAIKNAKNFGDTTEAASLQTSLSDLQSQESMPIVFEQTGVPSYGGVFGPFIKNNFAFAGEAMGALQGTQILDMKDFAMIAGTYGYGSADFDRYLKLREKIIEARIQGEAQKKEKLAELRREAE